MDEDEGTRAGLRLFTTFQRDQEEAPKRRRRWQTSQSIGLSGCSAANGIPLTLGQPTARLDFNYGTHSSESGSGIGPAQTAQIPQTVGTMNFVREQGGWRIDSMDPDFFHLSS